MLLLVLATACTESTYEGDVRAAGSGDEGETGLAGETGGDTADDSAGDSGGDSDPPAGPCPAEMALAGSVCVDRWEAYLDGQSPYDAPTSGIAAAAAGVVPQGYIGGDVAQAACAAAGKRLCTTDEWLRACEGPEGWTYPYGDTYAPDACNTSYAGDHPVCDYFGTCDGVWDMDHMNDPGINQQPGTEDPSGANPDCVTPEGIYDLHGNLHEWTADPAGTFKGGFYADASINGAGCTYTTTAHELSYHDYSTGFRCCREPDE